MKHLKYILIFALSSAMGTLQAQDLKELMKENRENRTKSLHMEGKRNV